MSGRSSSSDSMGTGAFVGLVIAGIVAVVVFLYFGLGIIFTGFKATDAGVVCVVRQGGLFDGRGIKEVRQPGSGVKFVGIWNHQDCLPVTERDTNDVLEGDPVFPSRDGVQLVADGQVVFQLTTDPKKVETFYKKYGRRKWDGKDLMSDEGWLSFLRQRFAPPVLDALRNTIGANDCTPLNNLCQYVQNPDAATDANQVEKVDTSQNLAKAQTAIEAQLKLKLNQAFGDDYFENVRYQNFRTRFPEQVQHQITSAQAKRGEVANAKLEADRKVAAATGDANSKVAAAKGVRQQAIELQKAYKSNPTQKRIDQIKAFCGEEGCDPQVFGSGNVITQLGNGG